MRRTLAMEEGPVGAAERGVWICVYEIRPRFTGRLRCCLSVCLSVSV